LKATKNSDNRAQLVQQTAEQQKAIGVIGQSENAVEGMITNPNTGIPIPMAITKSQQAYIERRQTLLKNEQAKQCS
jgi:hypothetical protein